MRSPSLTIPMMRFSRSITGTPLICLVDISLATSRMGVSGAMLKTSVVMTSAARNMDFLQDFINSVGEDDLQCGAVSARPITWPQLRPTQLMKVGLGGCGSGAD
jgi:hypothetical protein